MCASDWGMGITIHSLEVPATDLIGQNLALGGCNMSPFQGSMIMVVPWVPGPRATPAVRDCPLALRFNTWPLRGRWRYWYVHAASLRPVLDVALSGLQYFVSPVVPGPRVIPAVRDCPLALRFNTRPLRGRRRVGALVWTAGGGGSWPGPAPQGRNAIAKGQGGPRPASAGSGDDAALGNEGPTRMCQP